MKLTIKSLSKRTMNTMADACLLKNKLRKSMEDLTKGFWYCLGVDEDKMDIITSNLPTDCVMEQHMFDKTVWVITRTRRTFTKDHVIMAQAMEGRDPILVAEDMRRKVTTEDQRAIKDAKAWLAENGPLIEGLGQ
jgi:ribonucleotide monophosphatase NagD (HAD superfamily)